MWTGFTWHRTSFQKCRCIISRSWTSSKLDHLDLLFKIIELFTEYPCEQDFSRNTWYGRLISKVDVYYINISGKVERRSLWPTFQDHRAIDCSCGQDFLRNTWLHFLSVALLYEDPGQVLKLGQFDLIFKFTELFIEYPCGWDFLRNTWHMNFI